MSDDETVEVAGTPDETEDPVIEPTVPAPPLEVPPSSDTPATSVPADAPIPTDPPATAPVAPDAPPPVAGVVEVPPEPVAPPPPPPVGDAVAAIDAADDQARADQAKREADAFALSTNGIPPPPILPPPLAGVVEAPNSNAAPATTGSTLWICVTEEGPRTTVGGVACPIFLVQSIPPQGQLLTCPTCGGTSVRRATEEEQQLPQETTSAKVA
jgi:hypothetical protein